VRYNPRPATSLQVLGGGTRVEARTDLTDETLFLSNLPVIDEAVAQVCRRHRLSSTEAGDFASDVHLHFIEHNYERLRRFEGRSSLKTYITVCVQRCFLDYRNKLWGKWRPSAEAARLGPDAILLERMVVRDGWTIEQASEAMKLHHHVTIDDRLAALCVRLAQRQPPRERVPDDEADQLESPVPAPDAHVVRAEQDFLVKRVRAACVRACETLSPEERLILRMRFDEMAVADIARALHLNQKRLYRTIERLLAELRTRLEADGISRDEMRTLFASGALAGVESPRHQPALAGVMPGAAPERTPWRTRR
jgi:RNA polymerase sigma factor (sigma-70 family)